MNFEEKLKEKLKATQPKKPRRRKKPQKIAVNITKKY